MQKHVNLKKIKEVKQMLNIQNWQKSHQNWRENEQKQKKKRKLQTKKCWNSHQQRKTKIYQNKKMENMLYMINDRMYILRICDIHLEWNEKKYKYYM